MSQYICCGFWLWLWEKYICMWLRWLRILRFRRPIYTLPTKCFVCVCVFHYFLMSLLFACLPNCWMEVRSALATVTAVANDGIGVKKISESNATPCQKAWLNSLFGFEISFFFLLLLVFNCNFLWNFGNFLLPQTAAVVKCMWINFVCSLIAAVTVY